MKALHTICTVLLLDATAILLQKTLYNSRLSTITKTHSATTRDEQWTNGGNGNFDEVNAQLNSAGAVQIRKGKPLP